jgi:hypothetical protein
MAILAGKDEWRLSVWQLRHPRRFWKRQIDLLSIRGV